MSGYPHGLNALPHLPDTSKTTWSLKDASVEYADKLSKAKARIAELEEALWALIEDVEHEDHEAGDWSQQVVVRNARELLPEKP